MHKSIILVAALLVGCQACEELAAPLPLTATPMVPPANYAQDWRAMEQCSGLTGDFAAVKWYTVPNGSHSLTLTKDQVGQANWSPDKQEIILDSFYATSQIVVEHEIMHILLHGGANHPVKYFKQICGDLMPGMD